MSPTGEFSGTFEGSDRAVDKRILKVVITINHAKKDFGFDFSGDWRGRDIKVVIRHIFRSYQRYMKTRRDAEMPIAARQAATQTPPPVGEADVKSEPSEAPKQRRVRVKKENANAT